MQHTPPRTNKLSGVRKLACALLPLVSTLHHTQVDAQLNWSGTFDRQLSTYNIFKDAPAQLAADSFVPYDVITPLFSDYADKHRFIHIPDGTSMTYDPESAFEMPIGSALVKTFSYPIDARYPEQGRRLIETRLMVHTENGWTGAAYVWNEAQTEATLKVAGAEIAVDWIDADGYCRSIKYLVPDMNQCKNCHRDTTGKMQPIGIKARHLNRDFSYPDPSANQLLTWSKMKILKGAPEPESIPALARWDDPSAPLADRAMSYLEVNCAHCHNPAGLSSHTGLDLRWVQDDAGLRGVMRRPTAAGNAARGRYFAIVPGDPDASFLIHRIRSERPDVRMPPVGRTIVDAEGAQLLADWVKSLQK